jgi:ComF family protein
VDAPGQVKAGVSFARRLGAAGADFLFPPTCAACGAPVGEANAVCPTCWRKLDFITAPLCPVLGIPFAVEIGPGALSAEALANPPPFDRARSALRYNDTAARLISSLKYGDRTDLTRLCARLMVGAGAELTNGGAVLMPVPLHWSRQLSRRFNQSLLLARAIAAETGLSLMPDGLRRQRRTRHQVGLSASERERNVAGAFAAHPGLAERLNGRRALVIEDVITTGATVYALARALRRAGVEHIDILSFARVVSSPA